MKNASQLGIMPWPILYKLSLPGGSNHYGGTFPMSKNPQPLTTDINGRLYGYRNLHIVDGSVLPHIPPYSPTLTIMANAYRIGENISK